MQNTSAVLPFIIIAVINCATFVYPQNLSLNTNQPVTIAIKPGEERVFSLAMKKDGFAEIAWLAAGEVDLDIEVRDPANRKIETRGMVDEDSIVFIAPESGEYRFLFKLSDSPDAEGEKRVTLEYTDQWNLPAGAKLKGVRKVNGFDVKIMMPISIGGDLKSIVLFEKDGQLKMIWKQFGGEVTDSATFYFADEVTKTSTQAQKASAGLIAKTPDKTGDGIPDVIINYYSGGVHCCRTSTFVNLDSTPVFVEGLTGDAEQPLAISKNPEGGLYFSVADTGPTCWHFQPMIYSFRNGKLKPDLEKMKKPLPSLAQLKERAKRTRDQLSLTPYRNMGLDNEACGLYKQRTEPPDAFWREMLDLMISGNPDLAWQYFDVVWPTDKPGKETFAEDFKSSIAGSEWEKLLPNK